MTTRGDHLIGAQGLENVGGEDPADLTDLALELSLGTDERSYQHKLDTVRRMRELGLSDAEIELALVIKLKPEHRAGAEVTPVRHLIFDPPSRRASLSSLQSAREFLVNALKDDPDWSEVKEALADIDYRIANHAALQAEILASGAK